ncbi:MAG: META domain-containing protein [Sphingobacterium sp.]
MKQGILLAFFALSLAMLSCAGNKHSTGANFSKIADQKWQLVELNGQPVSGELNGKMPYLEFLTEDTRYVATGGCNTLNGTYSLTGRNKILFEPGITTMMACDDMETDRALTAVFANSNRFELVDDRLTLSKGGGEVLARFQAIDSAQSLGGTWELNYIAGSEEPFNELFPNAKPTLIFEEGSQKIHGRGGCNSFNGSVTIAGKEISFGPVASTKMACQGNGETLFFQALSKVNVHRVHENELTLIVDDATTMRFQKVAE